MPCILHFGQNENVLRVKAPFSPTEAPSPSMISRAVGESGAVSLWAQTLMFSWGIITYTVVHCSFFLCWFPYVSEIKCKVFIAFNFFAYPIFSYSKEKVYLKNIWSLLFKTQHRQGLNNNRRRALGNWLRLHMGSSGMIPGNHVLTLFRCFLSSGYSLQDQPIC